MSQTRRRWLEIFRSGLLFALVGLPLGAGVFLTGFGIAAGNLLAGFGILAEPLVAAQLTAIFGGIPAVVTGVAAGLMRERLSAFRAYLAAMALTGTLVTAIYQVVLLVLIYRFHGWPDAAILIGGLAATGGVSAFSCAVLFHRRPASSVRPAPR